MITEQDIRQMPMDEKLRLMEMVWEEIRRAGDEFRSPDWHRHELEETERRRQAGLEEPMAWETAKERLRKRENAI